MKPIILRTLKAFAAILALALIAVGIEYFGEQPMGLFAGTRPTDLGFSNGQFKPPSWKPNVVSSTVPTNDSHYIAPLALRAEASAEWKRLLSLVKAQDRVKVISERADYLHAEFKSKGMGFVDDVEFALDTKANVIHVRSGSRLGVRDFGVNRARIEGIRGQFTAK